MDFKEQLQAKVIEIGVKAKKEAQFDILVEVLLGFHTLSKGDPEDFFVKEAKQKLDALLPLIGQRFDGANENENKVLRDNFFESLENKQDAYKLLKSKLVDAVPQNMIDETVLGGVKFSDETLKEFRILKTVNADIETYNELKAAGSSEKAEAYFENKIQPIIQLFSGEKTNNIFSAMRVEFNDFSSKVKEYGKEVDPSCVRFSEMGKSCIDSSLGISLFIESAYTLASDKKQEVLDEKAMEKLTEKDKFNKLAVDLISAVVPTGSIPKVVSPNLAWLHNAVSDLSSTQSFLHPVSAEEQSLENVSDKEHAQSRDSFFSLYANLKEAKISDLPAALSDLYNELTKTPEGAFLFLGLSEEEILVQALNDKKYDAAYTLSKDALQTLSIIERNMSNISPEWNKKREDLSNSVKSYEDLQEKYEALKNNLDKEKIIYLDHKNQIDSLRKERDQYKQEHLDPLVEREKTLKKEKAHLINTNLAKMEMTQIAGHRQSFYNEVRNLLTGDQKVAFEEKLKEAREQKKYIIENWDTFLEQEKNKKTDEQNAELESVVRDMQIVTQASVEEGSKKEIGVGKTFFEKASDLGNKVVELAKERIKRDEGLATAELDKFFKSKPEAKAYIERENIKVMLFLRDEMLENTDLTQDEKLKLKEVMYEFDAAIGGKDKIPELNRQLEGVKKEIHSEERVLMEKNEAIRKEGAEQRRIAHEFQKKVQNFQNEKAKCYKNICTLFEGITKETKKLNKDGYYGGMIDCIGQSLEGLKKADGVTDKASFFTKVIDSGKRIHEVLEGKHKDAFEQLKERQDRAAVELYKDEEVGYFKRLEFNAFSMGANGIIDAACGEEKSSIFRYGEAIENKIDYELQKQQKEEKARLELEKHKDETTRTTYIPSQDRKSEQDSAFEDKKKMIESFMKQYKKSWYSNKNRARQLEALKAALESRDGRKMDGAVKQIIGEMYEDFDNKKLKKEETRWLGASSLQKFVEAYHSEHLATDRSAVKKHLHR